MKILVPTAALLLATPALANEPAADSAAPIKELEASGADSAGQLLELQQQMELEQRQYQTMQGVMKARHDTTKAVIQNVRGGSALEPDLTSQSSDEDDGDSETTDSSEMKQVSLQGATQQREQAVSATSNLLKKQQEQTDAIKRNIDD